MKVVASHRLGVDSGLDDGSLASLAEEVVCSDPCLIAPRAAAIQLLANQTLCLMVRHDLGVVPAEGVVDCFVDMVAVEEVVDGPMHSDLEEAEGLEYTVDVDCP